MTLCGAFLDHARRRPDQPALVCDDTVVTYGALAGRLHGWCAALAARGLRRGDHVGVVLPNGPEFVLLLLAAAALGLVLVPLPPGQTPAALARGFAATGIRHLVASQAVLAELRGTLDAAGATGLWLAIDAGGDFPDVAALLAEPAPAVPLDQGGDACPFILTMTSGSTGAPKPILLSQGTKRRRALAAAALYGVTAGEVTLAATPLYHSLAERLVLLPLITGGTAVLLSRFTAEAWLAAVARHSVGFTIAVSSQLGQVAAALATRPAPACLRAVVSSSAALAPEVKALLRARLGCALHECYGASEIAIATSLDLNDRAADIASVGRAAPGVDLLILGEDGRPAPMGQVGEILCRTPLLFDGYFAQPEQTAAAMWQGYFRTGDLGRLDDAGQLHFLGRRKELIITGGLNVIPADIERALAGFPGLVEAAAFALPDERLGEVVALAYVPAAPGAFDLRQLRRHCGRHLADYQQPHRFLALPALPRNALGKPMRHLLPELALAAEEPSP